MTTRPWMPLYIADYLADTAHLGALQSGAYLHLIMHYWQNGGLPEGDAALARIARLTPTEFRRERDMLAAFFQDGWKHKRIDAELAHAADVSSKRRASAERRHNKCDPKAPANAERLDTHARGLSQPQSQEEEPHPSDARPPAEPDAAKRAMEIYNAIAGDVGWPRVQRMTAPRRSAVNARLRECAGLEGWSAALDRAKASAFLRGVNDTGWRADFDFFCQAKSFTKLMEGSYDDRTPTAKPTSGGHDAQLRSIARVVEKRARMGGGQAGADDGPQSYASAAR